MTGLLTTLSVSSFHSSIDIQNYKKDYRGYRYLPYGVMPDTDSMCSGISLLFSNPMSHELIETITDPLQNAWIGETVNSENADLCAGHTSEIKFPNGHTRAQTKFWSNKKGECVDFGTVLPALENTAQLIQWQGGARRR